MKNKKKGHNNKVLNIYSGDNILSEYKTVGSGSLTFRKNYINGIGTDSVIAYDVDESTNQDQISFCQNRVLPYQTEFTTYGYTSIVDDCNNAQNSSTGIVTNRYYYHTNQLGSIIALTNSTGAVVQVYSYDAFGKVYVNNSGSLVSLDTYTGNTYGNTRLYTGREYDKEIGMYYLRARYYSPDTGRFINRDPIGQNDQVNLYTYVKNSPLMYTDPTGEFFETIWDAGNVLYDVGRGVKNLAEVGYEGAKYGYASVTGNTCLKKQALAGMRQDGSELGESSIDIAFDGLATVIPLVPAGGTKVLRMGTKHADEVASAVKDSKKIHGNSLSSQKPTTLYELTSKETGEHMKYGITSQPIPENRYTSAFLEDKKMKYLDTGTRREMHTLENQMILNNPRGPLQFNNH